MYTKYIEIKPTSLKGNILFNMLLGFRVGKYKEDIKLNKKKKISKKQI